MKKREVLLWLCLAAALLIALGLAASGRLSSLRAQASPLDAVSGAPAMGSAHFGLDWDVISAGGGAASSPHFQAATTVGQPMVGNVSSAHFALHIGYRQNLLTIRRLYLPIVLRGL